MSEAPTRDAADPTREARRREIEAYRAQRSEGWLIVDTRQSPSGQIVDYVLAETLYPGEPDAPFAPPPYELPIAAELEGAGGERIRPGVTEIEADPMLWPPPGTIPVLRESFHRYLEQGDTYRDLDDYIERLPHPMRELEARVYADHPVDIQSQELAGTLELRAQRSPRDSDEPSLLQLSEHCLSAGAVEDAVESGVIRSRELFGDDQLHLFTFYTRQGHGPDADYSEGWNLQTKGFVQYSGATSFPGAALDPSTLGSGDGDQYECVVKIHRAPDGNWWIYACNNWLGYYPTQRSTTVTAPERRIDFSQMAEAACNVQVYGVERHAGGAPLASGRGQPRSAGHVGGAYVRQLEFRTSTAAPLPAPAPLPDGAIAGGTGGEPYAAMRRLDRGAAFGDYFLPGNGPAPFGRTGSAAVR